MEKEVKPGMHFVFGQEYVLLQQLSTGERGQTFIAIGGEGQRVILKFTRDTEDEMAVQEAFVLGMLCHKGIPRLLETARWENYYILIREYVEGVNLAQYLIQNKASHAQEQEQGIAIGIRLAEILDKLHHCPLKIIYRDLKPENIVIDSMGNVHLVDFDAVLLRFHEQPERTVLAGTLGYAAPEQFMLVKEKQRNLVDERSDIYALGAVLALFLRMKERKGIQCFERSFLEYEQFLKKCMQSEKEKRYQNMQEVIKVLQQMKEPAEICPDFNLQLNRRKCFLAVNLFTLCLFIVAFLFSNLHATAAGEVLPVVFRNEQNQKFLLRYDMPYQSDENIKIEIPREYFPKGETWQLSIDLVNLESGERRERTLTLK